VMHLLQDLLLCKITVLIVILFQLTSMWEEKMREELEKTTPLEEVKKISPIRREVVIYIRNITFM